MKDKIEIVKIIQGEIEVTIECEPGTIRISMPPKETIKYDEYIPISPRYELMIPSSLPKFSIDGEMKSITLTK